MKLAQFFKRDFLNQNPTIKDVLEHYDSDVIDKKNGRYSKKEVSLFIDQSVVAWGTFLFGNRTLTNSVFKMIDKDKNNEITIEEIEDFLEKDYDLKLESIINKRVLEACDLVDQIVEKKKREKSKK